jgi:hypothetical protein
MNSKFFIKVSKITGLPFWDVVTLWEGIISVMALVILSGAIFIVTKYFES